jgi:nucleoside phosphorylase
MPQMPAYHLKKPGHGGITMINIGVGPSNAKTITDHVAVLRPHAWLMLGHCAGLRNTQQLGDYVLAHAYVREDHVLDDDLPVWIPIPPLAEVNIALQEAVAEITGLAGYELKRIMRTGTVATIDNRNWELRDQRGPVQRLSQSRAIALDMESATIAANGFRFRVPYGTLLCVSDKPLHGELKLPGMATEFYKRQVAQHLKIGLQRDGKAGRDAGRPTAFTQVAQFQRNCVPVELSASGSRSKVRTPLDGPIRAKLGTRQKRRLSGLVRVSCRRVHRDGESHLRLDLGASLDPSSPSWRQRLACVSFLVKTTLIISTCTSSWRPNSGR